MCTVVIFKSRLSDRKKRQSLGLCFNNTTRDHTCAYTLVSRIMNETAAPVGVAEVGQVYGFQVPEQPSMIWCDFSLDESFSLSSLRIFIELIFLISHLDLDKVYDRDENINQCESKVKISIGSNLKLYESQSEILHIAWNLGEKSIEGISLI